MAFRRLRVLHRQFVPRHSSSALLSLLYSTLTELLDALSLLYVAFKELVFLFARSHNLVDWISGEEKLYPFTIPMSRTYETICKNRFFFVRLARLEILGCHGFCR